jgi:hypothetical protein
MGIVRTKDLASFLLLVRVLYVRRHADEGANNLSYLRLWLCSCANETATIRSGLTSITV